MSATRARGAVRTRAGRSTNRASSDAGGISLPSPTGARHRRAGSTTARVEVWFTKWPRVRERARRRRLAGRGARQCARFGAGAVRACESSSSATSTIGLALVALGVFMACVLNLGWSGGRVGVVLRHAFAYALGMLVYAIPVALVAGARSGRPAFPVGRAPVRHRRARPFAALTLALSAGTLGLGPSGAQPDVWTRASWRRVAGSVGEALYTVADGAVQEVGAHILAIFLFSARLLLVTGATVSAGVLHAVRSGIRRHRPAPARVHRGAGADTRPADGGHRRRRARRARGRGAHGTPGARGPRARSSELHTWRAPSLDRPGLSNAALESGRARDRRGRRGAGLSPGTDPRRPAPASWPAAGPEDLTLQGRYRAGAEDPDFEPGGSRGHVPQALARRQRAAGHLEPGGRRGAADSRRSGTSASTPRWSARSPARTSPATSCASRRDQGRQGRPAQGRPRLRAGRHRDPHPRADPGKQAVGVEVPNARRRIVHLGDVFQDAAEDWSPLTRVARQGRRRPAIGADLANMPHLLVAGTTGAGKSARSTRCSRASCCARAARGAPRAGRPQAGRANHYDAIPHLLTPVITSPRMAANALQNLVKRDGAALRDDVDGAHAQPRRAQQVRASSAARRRCRTSCA